MKTFHIQTLGCKVNQYESQQIHQWLCQQGLLPVPDDQPADLAVINTCCVTRIASSKSRQTIRKVQKKNPLSRIIFTGCLTAGPSEELKNLPPSVAVVEKNRLFEAFQQILRSPDPAGNPAISKTSNACKIKHKNDIESHDPAAGPLAAPLHRFEGQTRAFLKIQDGCDAYCTYCIIPKIRRQLSSKPAEVILKEARQLVDSGHPEIVLTGIFISAWGRGTARRRLWEARAEDKFARLVDQVAQVPGLRRLRISSLEPVDLTDELLSVYERHDNLALHFHLPLQSGSPRILRRMARQYTVEEFLERCKKVKSRLDRPAITTDVIVGFPRETDLDFRNTLEICRTVQFAKIHVFPFSRREGTAASKLTPQIAPDVIRDRARLLNNLDKELQEKFRRQFIGEKVRVIVENETPPVGRCERYFEVDCSEHPDAARLQKGRLVEITLRR